MKAKIHDISIDYKTRKTLVTFMVDALPNQLEEFWDKVLELSVKIFSKGRSLDANAYFHVLCNELRLKNKVSMAEQKNDLIFQYGQIDILPTGEPNEIWSKADPYYIKKMELIHWDVIGATENGYWYRVYRGTHTYNVNEMNRLIEGTCIECGMEGIPTATPDEIAHMNELWRRKYDRGKQQER